MRSSPNPAARSATTADGLIEEGFAVIGDVFEFAGDPLAGLCHGRFWGQGWGWRR